MHVHSILAPGPPPAKLSPYAIPHLD
jgi:hypothetical protein